MELKLASQSPRRRDLLNQIGLNPEIININLEELHKPSETALQFVTRLAKEKARAGLEVCNNRPDVVVLGADTIVVYQDEIFGKPKDYNDARNMLSQLSGNTHQVYTAVCLHSKDKCLEACVKTDVTFKSISAKEIKAYWDSGEPKDKAGSYGIQGLGALFVEEMKGCYSAVVGLPVYQTANLLEEFGITVL